MIYAINDTHDPSLRSWVESANAPGTDFPIQNLPFGMFRRLGGDDSPRPGVGTAIASLTSPRAEVKVSSIT